MKRRVLDLLRRGDAGRWGIVLGLLFGLFLLTIPALAQTGGGYDLSWSTIDAGGGTFSTGGGYSVGGTIGQPDAGTYSGGGYAVTGGFWGAAVTSATPGPTNTSAPTNTTGPTHTPGRTNTPTLTHTPVRTNTTGPTHTPGSHTPTRTATSGPPPTACPIQFADVLPNNTFYPHVRCLACRGIDTGYPCGGPGEPCNGQNQPYFRINTLIKRDDLAHMVAASAGFNENPGPRRFQDVPPSNPYYVWVQRMANRGLIGGYPCGTQPGEPCVPPENLAYYRPSANATRGQIAKIVSNGAGYQEPPAGHFFTDVPPGSPFYEWVQRLTNRAVMSGYPCGGPNEPCDPLSRPYFRWQNDSTRGQVAKITASTFFPSCITPGGR